MANIMNTRDINKESAFYLVTHFPTKTSYKKYHTRKRSKWTFSRTSLRWKQQQYDQDHREYPKQKLTIIKISTIKPKIKLSKFLIRKAACCKQKQKQKERKENHKKTKIKPNKFKSTFKLKKNLQQQTKIIKVPSMNNVQINKRKGITYLACNLFHFNLFTKADILYYHVSSSNSSRAHRNQCVNSTASNNSSIASSTAAYAKQICSQTILTHFITQVMPRLCLIIVFLLSLMTTTDVQCVDCQRVMPPMSIFGKIVQTSKQTANDQYINLFQPLTKVATRIEKQGKEFSEKITNHITKPELRLAANNSYNYINNSNNSHNNSINIKLNETAKDATNLYESLLFNSATNLSLLNMNYSSNNLSMQSYSPYDNSIKVVEKYLYAHSGEQNNNNRRNIIKMNSSERDLIVSNSKSLWHEANNIKLLYLVMEGLNLDNLPDMTKVNISQQEYSTKYREYLRRVYKRTQAEQSHNYYGSAELLKTKSDPKPLAFWSIVTNEISVEQKRQKRELPIDFMLSETSSKITRRHSKHNIDMKTKIRLQFPLNESVSNLKAEDIEEANIRLMILYSPMLALKSQMQTSKRRCSSNLTSLHRHQIRTQKQMLNLKVFQLLRNGKRRWLDGQKFEITTDKSKNEETQSKWFQFDVTRAVEAWTRDGKDNLGLEVQCDNCRRAGARILTDDSTQDLNRSNITENRFELSPVLNIVGHLGVTRHDLRINNDLNNNNSAPKKKHHTAVDANKHNLSPKNKCKNNNQRCCRHTMEVVFKDIKGFEFIIQPKVFDAGYCQGRCPPRYNPANHHAMLQSLIWKQDHKLAPRPCCAPSKLVELEILHVDEKDNQKLKISTWSNMKVIECACS